MNPWQERHQVITSIAWVSRVEDARDSLLRSRWDLIIVDEAHKMAADPQTGQAKKLFTKRQVFHPRRTGCVASGEP